MQSLPEFRYPSRGRDRKALAAAMLLALVAAPAFAADSPEIKPPGLPPGIDWKFNFDATFGAFGFGDSLYTNPKPGQPSGDLSDNWFEGSVKPALSGAYTLGNSSQLYGKMSAVGERTYSASPPLVGGDNASFAEEDLYIGWRSGNSSDMGENAFDVTIGRAPYKIGHGMLLWDGAAEGGSRGGYWTNARKAWEFAAVGRFKTEHNLVETFYLEKNELPEFDTHDKVVGLNIEFSTGEQTTLGATYMQWSADALLAPQRDGLKVYDVRAFTAPFATAPGLSFEFEYAKEDNGDALDSLAWNALIGYEFQASWKPKLSYRYAQFKGDDPSTAANEGFDGLSTGFYDWGTWWQGEIGGEYFLSNSNLVSNQIRLHMKPNDGLGTGFIFYDFRLDKPSALGPTVTSDKAAYEFDWYADWSVNKNLVFSFVAAAAEPQAAIEQSSGRTRTFFYGMVYAAYSF